jgi:hypothetical protein
MHVRCMISERRETAFKNVSPRCEQSLGHVVVAWCPRVTSATKLRYRPLSLPLFDTAGSVYLSSLSIFQVIYRTAFTMVHAKSQDKKRREEAVLKEAAIQRALNIYKEELSSGKSGRERLDLKKCCDQAIDALDKKQQQNRGTEHWKEARDAWDWSEERIVQNKETRYAHKIALAAWEEERNLANMQKRKQRWEKLTLEGTLPPPNPELKAKKKNFVTTEPQDADIGATQNHTIVLFVVFVALLIIVEDRGDDEGSNDDEEGEASDDEPDD